MVRRGAAIPAGDEADGTAGDEGVGDEAAGDGANGDEPSGVAPEFVAATSSTPPSSPAARKVRPAASYAGRHD
jgi:hypothetical protein